MGKMSSGLPALGKMSSGLPSLAQPRLRPLAEFGGDLAAYIRYIRQYRL